METMHVGYIIWEPSSTLPPTKVFQNKSEAIRVAFSMANRNPTKCFYVAKLDGVAKVERVVYKEIDA